MADNTEMQKTDDADAQVLDIGEMANVTALPLARQAAILVRDMIVMDELKQGEPIRERIVSQKLNISRTPLREGLKILATEGLVDLIPNRGAVVAKPSPEETRDRLVLLGAMERLAGELAASLATDSEIDEITALHYEMLAAQKRKNRLEYFKINQDIHKSLVRASRNSALIENHKRINMQVYRDRFRNNLDMSNWDHSMVEHEKIISALQSRDGQSLAELLSRHLEPIWTAVMEGAKETPEVDIDTNSSAQDRC